MLQICDSAVLYTLAGLSGVDNAKLGAAEMKAFGKLRRKTVEWIPDRLVCIR